MRTLLGIVLGCLLLMAFASPAGPAPATDIRGQVLDTEGAVIANATVRVLDAKTRATITSVNTDRDGRFDISGLPPGSYVLAVAAKGFPERLLDAQFATDQTVTLGPPDCDAPDINCDIVTSGPYTGPDPVVMHKDVTVSLSGAVDLVKGEFVPPESRSADIRLSSRDGGLYLSPLNHAAIGVIDWKHGACVLPHTKLPELRVDGMGPRNEICIRTHRSHWSKLFTTQAVDPGSDRMALHVVTRN